MKNRGFTRMETVLVLAVTATIGALLLPALSQANDAWREAENQNRAQCMQNLKQLGLGMMQYVQDYDERLPTTYASYRPSGYGWVTALEPYLRTRALFQCPSEKHAPGDNPQQSGYTDYWYNSNLSNSSLAGINLPALTLLMGDGDGGSPASTARYAINKLPNSWTESALAPARRHLYSGANYAFVDGHVKWLRPEQVTSVPLPKPQKGTFVSRYTFSVD